MVSLARHPSLGPAHLVPWKMKLWMIAIWLLFVSNSFSQDPEGVERSAMELIESGQTGQAEELYATIRSHLDQPVDLNFSSREELVGTGIFTPFQAFVIVDQRERYGPFLSIYELCAIPGISRDFLEEIRGMVTLTSESTPNPPAKFEGTMLSNVAVRLPNVSGMLNSPADNTVYKGSILKCSQRIRLNYGDQISFGLAYEKDAGEPVTNRKRPEHLTGYLSWDPGQTIRKLVIGNFRIHRGMGLVHKLGFSYRGTGDLLNSYTRSYGKPFASTLEYDYFRGVYGQAAVGKWELDLFLSHLPVDISFHRLRGKNDLFEMTRQTGLHRTTGERDGFDLARFTSAGTSFNRSGHQYYAGVSISGGEMHLTATGVDSLGGTGPMQSGHAAAALYGVVFGTTYEVFGEFAMDHTFHSALLFGGTLTLNPALSGEVSLKRIAPGYRGMMPAPERDEEDVYDLRLGCRLTPFRYARFRLYHELQLASPGISVAGPGVPERYTILEFMYRKGNGPEITLKYTGKTVQELLTAGRPGNGLYQGNRAQHFRIHYRWEPIEKIILQGRIEVSNYRMDMLAEDILPGSATWFPCRRIGSGTSNATGSMAYQQVQIIPRDGIRITCRFLLFQVADWENRIYTYEPGVRYSFLFPSWYGAGSRNVMVFSARIRRRVTLRGKCGLTHYAHRWHSGSGNDQRNGDRVFDAELQLQVNLF